MTTLKQAHTEIIHALNSLEISNKNSVAWWILEHGTNLSQAQIFLNQHIALTQEQIIKIKSILSDLVIHNKPLQYIIGHVDFLNLKINTEAPILIPRPETEYWCDLLIKKLYAYKNDNLKILDMCTGSGCIGLSFAKKFINSTVYLSDINPSAINLAKKNAYENDINNVVFTESDLFNNLNSNYKFDLIVSNPPYLSQEEWNNCKPIVKNWESQIALAASNNGFSLLNKIIEQSPLWLSANNKLPINLAIEFSENQTESLINFINIQNYKANVQIIKDLAKKDRCLWISYT